MSEETLKVVKSEAKFAEGQPYISPPGANRGQYSARLWMKVVWISCSILEKTKNRDDKPWEALNFERVSNLKKKRSVALIA
jgi:hypothetical protein